MNRILRVLDENIRVLPVLVLAAGFLFVMKSADLWTDAKQELLGISSAYAVEHAAEDTGTESAADHGAPEEGHGEQTAEEAALETYESWRAGEDDNYLDTSGMGLSLAEIRVLESLSERREELEQRENELGMREHLIDAAERRVEQRIEELRTLEAHIQDLLLQRDDDEEAQMASLVSVYETMRAKDAAAIFENLETGILVAVASRMREARMAPILAEMEPESARDLTVLLATRLDIPGTE